MASGATPLDPGWVRGELSCTKGGMRRQRDTLSHTQVLHQDGAGSKLTIVATAERLAPLVAARGDEETPAFPVMAKVSVVSVSAVGTASFKNAEGVG